MTGYLLYILGIQHAVAKLKTIQTVKSIYT